ncbi:MAG TPA: peptidoglycan-binding protein LysM [Rhodanobacteraceae bacterium]|nr:peptidoglycan-binding protein LysM [Rhodanobacteraceae bacterium]
MGIFDFVKDAGAKILESAGDAAGAILGHVKTEVPDANASDVQVEYIDGTAKVSGTAASQADKEKIILAAGNVHGVDKIDDNITVSGASEAESRMYTVKSGDTLSAIAKAMYGHANEYHKIFEANKPMLKDPDKIYPGQVLRIP